MLLLPVPQRVARLTFLSLRLSAFERLVHLGVVSSFPPAQDSIAWIAPRRQRAAVSDSQSAPALWRRTARRSSEIPVQQTAVRGGQVRQKRPVEEIVLWYG